MTLQGFDTAVRERLNQPGYGDFIVNSEIVVWSQIQVTSTPG